MAKLYQAWILACPDGSDVHHTKVKRNTKTNTPAASDNRDLRDAGTWMVSDT